MNNRIFLNVKPYRKDAGLTQQELADLAGVSRATINKMENGDKASLSTINKIAKALDLKAVLVLAKPSDLELRIDFITCHICAGKGLVIQVVMDPIEKTKDAYKLSYVRCVALCSACGGAGGFESHNYIHKHSLLKMSADES